MTNTQLIILLVVLAALYFYWKKQQQPVLKSQKDNQAEPEIFWDASEFELDSDDETENNNLPPEQQDWFTPQHWLSDQEID